MLQTIARAKAKYHIAAKFNLINLTQPNQLYQLKPHTFITKSPL